MLSELDTLTLFRLDTCTIWFVISTHCKHWEYLRYLHSNFLQFKYQDHSDYCTQKQKQGFDVAIQNIMIFPPDLIVLFILQSLVLIVNISHNTVVKRKQRGSNEQLFHLQTFRPAASGIRQILYLRKTEESW